MPREQLRMELAEEFWLDSKATWSEIYQTAKLLGPQIYEALRARIADILDGTIPAF